MNTKEILLAKYGKPEQLKPEGATAPSSIQDVHKSALPNLFDHKTFGDWVDAVNAALLGYTPAMRDLVIKAALQNYLKE